VRRASSEYRTAKKIIPLFDSNIDSVRLYNRVVIRKKTIIQAFSFAAARAEFRNSKNNTKTPINPNWTNVNTHWLCGSKPR
jgi:hypothetical protein